MTATAFLHNAIKQEPSTDSYSQEEVCNEEVSALVSRETTLAEGSRSSAIQILRPVGQTLGDFSSPDPTGSSAPLDWQSKSCTTAKVKETPSLQTAKNTLCSSRYKYRKHGDEDDDDGDPLLQRILSSCVLPFGLLGVPQPVPIRTLKLSSAKCGLYLDG